MKGKKRLKQILMMIMTIKDRSTPVMLDSNVRKNQTYGNNSSRSFKRFESNLIGSFEELYNLNKRNFQKVFKTLKDINFKIYIKTRSGNDEMISHFNYIMMETINKLCK